MTDLERIMQKVNNRPPSLWNVIRHSLGYSVDCTNEIVEAVDNWVQQQTDMVEEYEKRIICERLWDQPE